MSGMRTQFEFDFNLCFVLFADGHLLASIVQEDGRAILYCEGQGSLGPGCSPQDRDHTGAHQRQPGGQDLAVKDCRGVQDQL